MTPKLYYTEGKRGDAEAIRILFHELKIVRVASLFSSLAFCAPHGFFRGFFG